MSDTQKAGIFPWPKTSIRCNVYACNRPAEYILRHVQGIFGDTHFHLCRQCAEDIARNLPPELRALVVPAREVETINTVSLIEALIASPEIQALAKGGEAPKEVTDALGRLIDMLAEAGAGVEAPPEGQEPLPTSQTHQVILDEFAFAEKGKPETTEALAPKPERRRPDFGDAPVADTSPTKGEPFTCPVCGAGPFKNKNALNGHVCAKHGGWPK